jgi:hypothetical protein
MSAGDNRNQEPESGIPYKDPTSNVLDLVAAAIQRQDDLRKADRELFDARLAALTTLVDTKESGIQREFVLIESRRIEQKVDTKIAVDAALSAAEKAVHEYQSAFEKAIAKSERMAEEQSKQQNATFNAMLSGVQTTLSDLKDRVVAIESKTGQAAMSRSTSRLDVGIFVGIAGFLVAVIALFFRMSGGG